MSATRASDNAVVRSPKKKSPRILRHSSSGVALILVIFLVALASILVVNLAYSTHLSSRRVRNVERSFQAEYLLKSAVNFARTLLKEDKTAEDSEKDITWGPFMRGLEVPAQLLEVTEPNVRIELEIRPEDSKIPLSQLVPSTTVNERWRDVLVRLFQNLGFDSDNEEDQTGLFKGKVFSSEELVANLIDYMDSDKESYSSPSMSGNGIEANLPDDFFPNRVIERLTELNGIPGFTPSRMRKLEPLLTVGVTGGSSKSKTSQININTAPPEVLKALHPDIDDKMVEAIIDFRAGNEGPITSFNKVQKLQEILGESVYQDIQSLINESSRLFQVIGKVDYGTATYFVRAYIEKPYSPTDMPEIKAIQLY